MATARRLGDLVLDAYLPLSMCVSSSQFYHVLKHYKSTSPRDASARERYVSDLVALAWRFLAQAGHEECLAEACGVPRFDVVAIVPSTSGRAGPHPLESVVQMATPFRGRYWPVLVPHKLPADPRAPAEDRFRAVEELDQQAVLLLEDLWVTGNHLQSAAAALKAAGASKVGGFSFGRYFQPDHPPTEHFLKSCAGKPFRWDECCLEEFQEDTWPF